MTEKINRINSPLTIIAIFAALAEVNATIAIGLIDDSLHYIFIWFVIGFPTLLVILFFITLNYNTKVMYSPSDFREDKNFIDSLYGQKAEIVNSNIEISNDYKSIEEIETRMIKSINDKIEKLSKENLSKEELTTILENQKEEIRKISNEATDSYNYPNILKKEFAKWIAFPAYLPIIYAIVKQNEKTISGLKKVEKNYNLPSRWYIAGLRGLSNILDIDDDNISIKNSVTEPLKKWIDTNEKTILEIIEVFGLERDSDEDNDDYRNRIKSQASVKAQKLLI